MGENRNLFGFQWPLPWRLALLAITTATLLTVFTMAIT